jgi:hypothetical protein
MTALNLHMPFDCFDIPFENLNTLGIFYHGRLPLPVMGSGFMVALIKLLVQAKNVRTIAGDESSIMTPSLIPSTSSLPTGLDLTADRLRIWVMDRQNAGRIEEPWEVETMCS